MSFDWMSFAEGFMKTTIETADKRAAEAKDFENEQRRAAERNMQTVSRRRAIADRVTGYANYLRSNGVSDAQLQAAISSGPQAIQELTKRVQEAVVSNGGRALGAADVDALISMPEGFTPLDMSAKEFIDKTYGLSVTPSVKEEQDFNFLDRLGGRDEMSLARQRLNRTPFVDGMTIEQVNRAAMQGDYQSLVPGTFASIIPKAKNSYTADVSADFMGDLRKLLNDVRGSDAWTRTAGLPEDQKAVERKALLQGTADSFIRRSVKQYGMEFLADQTQFLELQLGEDYVQGLIGSLTRPEETSPSVEPQPLSPASQAFLDSEDAAIADEQVKEPPVADSVVTPEVTTTELPPVAPRVKDKDIPDNIPVQPVPSANATVSVEGGDTFTYAEWEGMTKSERRKAGLPTGQLKAQFYFNRFSAGITGNNDLRFPEENRPAMSPAEVKKTATYKALSDQGVDDVSIALLRSHGTDMLKYVRDAGVKSNEELVNALSQWGQENNITMPFDKSAIIYALNVVLKDQ